MDVDIDNCSISMTIDEPQLQSTEITISIRPKTVSDVKEKKKGVFQMEWKNLTEFSSWVQEVKTNKTKARFLACLKTALNKHKTSDNHKKNMKPFENNILLPSKLNLVNEQYKVSAMEATLVYHGVKHGHSYNSQQCTVNLIKNTFGSCSATAKKLSCGRTKARAIASDVLAPYFVSKLIDELLESRFYSLSFDASNKGNIKTYPFAVQYFSNIGVRKGKEYCST